MVYIHFPANLTEEEEILQRKYAKLRKKKKALQEMRTPKPEPQAPVTTGIKRQASESAEDAKEQAKKLVKSGLISFNSGKKDSQGFKRSRNFERKLKDQEKTQSVTFQPFSPAHGSEPEEESGKSRVKNLYDSFVSSRDSKDRRESRDWEHRDREPPKKGNTVYVHGHGVNEDLLRRAFSNFGTIVNISMEADKNVAFVTFEKMESADNAISQVNSCLVSGVQLKVSMARRQPTFEQSADPNNTWSSIAASHSQKGSHKDKRDLVAYDEDDMF